MPYKSDAQRRFFHTDTAKKKGITDKEVNEFDQASKGMKLPEKKMAYGGETNAKHETVKSMENNPTAGFADGGEVAPEMKDDQFTHGVRDGMFNGINGDWEAIKKAITDGANSIHQKYIAGMGDTGNLKGLQNIANQKAGKEPQMADGGMLDSLGNVISAGANDIGQAGKAALGAIQQYNPLNMIAQGLTSQALTQEKPQLSPDQLQMAQNQTNQANPDPFQQQMMNGTAGGETVPSTAMNPISQVHQAAQSTPPTAPGIYQGITANDRAALMQQLIAQKSAPGMLAAKGAAGLGDAITSAFGKAPTNALGNMRQNEQQNMEQRIGVMDTQRQQRTQDLQANMLQQENDPKSPYSNGMRQFVGSFLGKTVPSGVSAAMLKSSFSDIAKIFDAQMQAHSQHEQHKVEAGKALQDETFWHKIGREILPDSVSENTGENTLENIATEGKVSAPAGASMSGWGNVRRSQ